MGCGIPNYQRNQFHQNIENEGSAGFKSRNNRQRKTIGRDLYAINEVSLSKEFSLPEEVQSNSNIYQIFN